MDAESKMYVNEGVPFNTSGAAKVFLNIGNKMKVNSPEGSGIRHNTDKPSDNGIHIYTTFPTASSKKIKLLFVLNFLLSVISMVISCAIAFYYFNDVKSNVSTLQYDLSRIQRVPESVVVHFNGAYQRELGKTQLLGPWIRDEQVSSKNSHDKIELNGDYVTIKEDGLYLIYTQVVYQTKLPNTYYVWANGKARPEPRQLTTCSTNDISTDWPLSKSQVSCATQTVARLYKGDTVNLAQREPNRTIILKLGYSYLGFVKLSS